MRPAQLRRNYKAIDDCSNIASFSKLYSLYIIIKIEQILISSIIGRSEGGFRSRDERKWAEKNVKYE
jgi:hypothetical protein